MPRRKLLTACSLIMMFLLVGAAWAQQNLTTPAADTLKVDYFANANTVGSPDGTARITNPGTSGGNLCADIYVFDANEEMSECCSCLVTPDGLLTLSVNTDLTGNPLTGVFLTTGVIKVVSGAPKAGTCPLPTAITPTAALRVWVTHIQNNGALTEDSSPDATFSSTEQSALQGQCNSIKRVGSGKGVCANSTALAAICNT
jgi:hypothetical protein